MTAPVITVTPQTPVREAAALLAGHAISAVPVIEGERLVGILSEGDLLQRHEIGTDCALRGDPWWLRFFRTPPAPDEYVRSHAALVKDAMTDRVFTVGPGTALWEIAAIFEKRGIKRVPVVDAGRVVGIVSRSDLVKALAAVPPPAVPHGDEAIREQLLAELERQPWWRRGMCDVTVEDGIVTYRGVMELRGEEAAARVAAEGIPGVRGVVDHRLAYIDLPSMV